MLDVSSVLPDRDREGVGEWAIVHGFWGNRCAGHFFAVETNLRPRLTRKQSLPGAFLCTGRGPI
jgi:hypothetical protein